MKGNSSFTPLRKLGYESGIGTESIVYNMFYIYFLIFLTNVAGIKPALAGTISLISVLVDAFTDPLIGWICDKPHVDSKKFMLFGGVMTGIMLGLTFIVVPGGQGFKFVYYVIVSSLMWVAYTCFCIPYYACCAQMTDDYDEQTKIRGISSTMNAFFIYAGCVFPILFVGFYTGKFGDSNSWTAAAFSIGVLSIIFGLINWFSIKDVKFIKKAASAQTDGLFKTYLDLLRLKPMRWFIPWVFFLLFGTAMVSANTDYIIIYAAGLDPSAITQTALVTVLCFLFGSLGFTWVATKWDRKVAVVFGYSICIVGVIAVRIHSIDSIAMIYALTAFTGMATVAFWCFFYDFAYDLIELDEYKNHKNRAGAITSFPQLIQKLGNAVGLQVIGIALSMVGFDAAQKTQTVHAIAGIQDISTIYLAICIGISLVCIIFYPVNKKIYSKLQAANERRRNGDVDFIDPDVEKII